MHIAVIGSGISGLASAWLLQRRHEVTLFEAADYLGGHTHTVRVNMQGRVWNVDTGFIVFNHENYPLFSRLLNELHVGSQATNMSFSVSCERTGLEYAGSDSLNSLFAQRINVFRLRFWQLVRDILRFYETAPALLATRGPGPSIREYLDKNGYSSVFADQHLLPMASALWSTPPGVIDEFPARYLVEFMANHRMLQRENRPDWRVVKGGSSTYVRALEQELRANIHLRTPVKEIERLETGVRIRTTEAEQDFDAVVLACHSDQALRLLADPSEPEREILGAIPYSRNETVLHTDTRLLPKRRRARASWNYRIPQDTANAATVTYNMNMLQGLRSPHTFCVSLNPRRVADETVLRRFIYDHPVYTRASVAAQKRRNEINGRRNTWYCGAWWGWGFHEDGIRSAVETAEKLGVPWT